VEVIFVHPHVSSLKLLDGFQWNLVCVGVTLKYVGKISFWCLQVKLQPILHMKPKLNLPIFSKTACHISIVIKYTDLINVYILYVKHF